MFDWVCDNLTAIQGVTADLAKFGSGAFALACVLGLKRRFDSWREGRRQDREEVLEGARVRGSFYAAIYHDLVIRSGMPIDRFHGLTVQQACAYRQESLPEWATGQWGTATVGSLNGLEPVRTLIVEAR